MTIPTRNADPRGIRSGEPTFFVTSSALGKRTLLQSDRAAALLVETLQQYRAAGKYKLHAFVVMPDHVHVLLTVAEDMTIEKAVQLIKGGFSFRASRELGIRGGLWQRGFSEIRILEAERFARAQAYIHENPVRAHACALIQEYPYSSANSRFDLDPMPQGLKPSQGTAERHG